MLTYEDFAILGKYLHELAQQKCVLLYSYIEKTSLNNLSLVYND